MASNSGFGVVYTPDKLANFLATLVQAFSNLEGCTLVDPACGEGALLKTASLHGAKSVCGFDVDPKSIERCKSDLTEHAATSLLFARDFLVSSVETLLQDCGGKPDFVLANPPWGTETRYSKTVLRKNGFRFTDGQVDSYSLFVERSMEILEDDGIAGFIVPDSIFELQNHRLREWLASEFSILCICRMGEGYFPGVYRASAIVILQKKTPESNSVTECCRFTHPATRRASLSENELSAYYRKNKHDVRQKRFLDHPKTLFDIDTRSSEQLLLSSFEKGSSEFIPRFGRGVEIGKSGFLQSCISCGNHFPEKTKRNAPIGSKCPKCGIENSFSKNIVAAISSNADESGAPFVVGEDVDRYSVRVNKFLKLGLMGVKYKNASIYEQHRIAIRKTGLGLKAAYLKPGIYTSQTVYHFLYAADDLDQLFLHLALLNSRLIYYYYVKRFGQSEWKSHPYLTKEILLDLPVWSKIKGQKDFEISRMARSLVNDWSRAGDIELEKAIFEKYGVDTVGRNGILKTLNSLPKLGSISTMPISKIEAEYFV